MNTLREYISIGEGSELDKLQQKLQFQSDNSFAKQLDNSRIPISKCYNCLEKCNPAKVPYCITKALINAVKGDVDNGLIFCGDNVGRINEITTVHSLMKELSE